MSDKTEIEKNKNYFKNKILEYLAGKNEYISAYLILISVNFNSPGYMHECLRDLLLEKKIEKSIRGYKLKG